MANHNHTVKTNWIRRGICILFLLLGAAVPALNAAPGEVDTGFNPNADGTVYFTATQPDGKILVGYGFTLIGGQPRNYLARLLADGSIDTEFNPNANFRVTCLRAREDGKLLIGGAFTTVGGQPRNYLALLNADGSLDTAFCPNANGSVYSLVIQGDGKIVVGGYFTTINGQPRNRIARLQADGSLDAGFDPNANGSVNSLAVQPDGKILLGGFFTTVAGYARNYLARLNADGSLDAGFNPDANAAVYALAVQADGRILVGGDFYTVAGTSRMGIARLNADGSLDMAFTAKANYRVNSLLLQADGRIIIGGNFTSVNMQTRNRIGRLEADGTLDANFNPNANSTVYSLAMQMDGRILAGGEFTALDGQSRYHIARIENDAGAAILTVPGTNHIRWVLKGAVPELQWVHFDLAPEGGTNWAPLGIGTRIAEGWELSDLNLPESGRIRVRAQLCGGYGNGSAGQVELSSVFPTSTIAVEHSTGAPLRDGGIENLGMAKIDAPNYYLFIIKNLGQLDLTGLNITIDGPDASLFRILTNATPAVLGPNTTATFTVQFAPTNVGPKVAAVHIASNDQNKSSYDITLLGTGSIPDIAVASGTDLTNGATCNLGPVLIHGIKEQTFTIKNIGGVDLTEVHAAIAGPDAALFTIVSNPAPTVSGLTGSTTVTVQFAPTNTALKTAVLHIESNDADENPFDLILTATGRTPISGDVDTDFNPNAVGGIISAMAFQGDGRLLVGGCFTNMSGQTRHHLARINADGSLDSSFNPSADGEVYCLCIEGNETIWAGGMFTNLAGQTCNGIAHLTASGDLVPPFNLAMGSLIRSTAILKQADGKILVGGYFTALDGQWRTNIARLNADGRLDTNFNSFAGNSVYSMVCQPDGKILVWGSFNTICGQSRNGIARLNADGSLDADFDPNAGSGALIFATASQADGKILVGGRFTSICGQARTNLARLNADGSLDVDFNPNVSGHIYTIALQANGKFLIGGFFTDIGRIPRNRIARLNGDGSVDAGFNPDANSYVRSLAIQSDGKILVGGDFTALGGQPRNHLARLENEPATQMLTVPSNRRVEWLRGGSAPEAQSVAFDLSTDGGTNWNSLGMGTRIPGGWELTGLSLPGGLVRARARVISGKYNGSSGLVEAMATAPVVPALGHPSLAPSQIRIPLPTVIGKVYLVQFAPALGDESLWQTVQTINGDGTVIEVFFTPANPKGFYRVLLAP